MLFMTEKYMYLFICSHSVNGITARRILHSVHRKGDLRAVHVEVADKKVINQGFNQG